MQIKTFFFIFFTVFCCNIFTQDYIIVLDPTGDARKTGRSIEDSFERGLTLQYVEKVKSQLEQKITNTKIFITRCAGETIAELQNASFSNRINAHLFINVSFYYTTDTKPTLFLFRYSDGTHFVPHQQELACIEYHQAYKINRSQTDVIADTFCHYMQTHYACLCAVSGPHSLPIKSLMGVTAPSLSIEIGLKNKNAWLEYVEPMADTIAHIIQQYEHE